MLSAPVFLAVALFPLEREVANRSASGIALRLEAAWLFPLLAGAFLLFLTLLGLALVQSVARAAVPLRGVLGLPSRRTARREWALGVALGWSVPLSAALLLVLTHGLQFTLWAAGPAWLMTFTSLAGLLASTLAFELTFRGLPFRWLADSLGPAWASILLSAAFALVVSPLARHSLAAFVVALLLGEMLAIGWLRTHALWLSWGAHFAWTATLGILFGLPVEGSTSLSAVVQGNLSSAHRLLGGIFGPEASPLTVVFLLLAIAVLTRATRDYAWQYTLPVLVPAGYPVDVPPPAAHTAAFGDASAPPPPPPPLVQILPQTPQERSQSTSHQ